MAWQFRKRIKVAPGVTINLSKGGVSTTIGTRGASLTMGNNGTFINTSIPGTGLYQRKKISSPSPKDENNNVVDSYTNYENRETIIGFIIFMIFLFILSLICYALTFTITGTILLVIAFALLTLLIACSVADNKREVKTDEPTQISIPDELNLIDKAIAETTDSANKLVCQILTAYKGCIETQCKIDEATTVVAELEKRNRKNKYGEIIEEQKQIIEKLKNEYSELEFNADLSLSDNAKVSFVSMIHAFENIAKCDFIYKFESDAEIKIYEDLQNYRTEISFGSFDLIKSEYKIPILDISTSSTKCLLYFYPLFIIKAESSTNFSIIKYKEFNTHFEKNMYYWVTQPSTDCEVVEDHYLYERKDGFPDLRYTYNPLAYHVYYGLTEMPKLNVKYLISNPKVAEELQNCIINHIQCIDGKHSAKKKVKTKDIHKEQKDYIEDKDIKSSYIVDSPKIDKDMTTWKNPYIKNGNFILPEEIISKFERSINRLGYFMDKYCMDGEFMNIVKFNLPQVDETYVPSMVASDVLTCVERMGKQINMKSDIGIPLVWLAMRVWFHKEIKRNYFYVLEEESYNGMCSFLDISKQLRDSATGLDTFFISTFFSHINKERNQKYLDLLYDFANIVASLDGSVEPRETEFLHHILELKDVDYTSEDKDAEETTDNAEEQEVDANGTSSFKESIKELEDLIGLNSVKKDVQTLMNFVTVQQKREKRGLKSSSVSYHCVFTGNPGTGKTTVARIVADIYKGLGVLKRGHLVETDRAGLVAEYVGQTAVKTNKIIDTALDGVLFIDEAYSLIGGGESDYGKEAIATLLKRMEDDRDRLVVILAGYTKDMKQFIDSNPGLQSRFNRYIEFPDYTADELYQIFALNLKKYDYHITDDAKEAIIRFFNDAVNNKDANFGNGRFVRNIFEKVLERQANRLASESNLTTERLSEITVEDLP